jgi:hypothetical protein
VGKKPWEDLVRELVRTRVEGLRYIIAVVSETYPEGKGLAR